MSLATCLYAAVKMSSGLLKYVSSRVVGRIVRGSAGLLGTLLAVWQAVARKAQLPDWIAVADILRERY